MSVLYCTKAGKIQYHNYWKVPIIGVPMLGSGQNESLTQKLIANKKCCFQVLRRMQNEIDLTHEFVVL